MKRRTLPPARWWHAALLLLVAQIPNGLVLTTRGYMGFAQWSFAPPPWLFGPVWTLNIVGMAVAAVRLVNAPPPRHGRALAAMQALCWLIYASFTFVYFGLRSPILCLGWTAAMCALTWASISLARRDRISALLLLPTALWTSYALPVAVGQLWLNGDPLFGLAAP